MPVSHHPAGKEQKTHGNQSSQALLSSLGAQLPWRSVSANKGSIPGVASPLHSRAGPPHKAQELEALNPSIPYSTGDQEGPFANDLRNNQALVGGLAVVPLLR